MAAQTEYPAESHGRNGRWAHALPVLICIVGVLSLKSDSTAPTPRALVIFMGNESSTTDTSFVRFMAAMDRLPAANRHRMTIRFIDARIKSMDTITEAARQMASLRPTLVVAPSSATAAAAKAHVAKDTPIVFGSFLDPVRYGIVSSMERRPEAMAGVWVADTLDAKRLEILHDAYPNVKRVAVLIDRSWGEYFDTEKNLPPVATQLGMEVTVLYAENAAEVRTVLAHPRATNFDAWCIPRSGMSSLNTPLIVDQLRVWGKPVILANNADMSSGAPLSYALDMSFAWPAMAELVMRVLEGEKPGTIPVLRPQRAVLAVQPYPKASFPTPSAQVVQRADLVLP